ncbi:type I polyketide synthase [Shouchella hunanensis]|uniref:Beta-ketoacyl synthase N-terminal-like domain-containing protein n=1 Tax=Shouchella hunanensis TaxID=766894 RepID=A0ABY7W299_9BACI|nr:type I polyketide synthase [Shouchella hunanensis]WDF02037.1 beta-ketoacyl synthase N-terminal-like domain-containing protein [Shouchella hunanensis]
MKVVQEYNGLEIAVIGMSGRFPGASTKNDFWDNLVNEKESISFFEDEELISAGVDPDLMKNPNFVKAKGIFPNLDSFDAEFFNYTPKDASLLDPQVRALHEEVYHALEDAGYGSEKRRDTTGVFLGATNNFSWELQTVLQNLDDGHHFATLQLNDKDFASTRIAYSLNLQGPSVTVHSACSTSLFAIDLACRNLLTGSCSLAIAGGSGLTLPSHNGYLSKDGRINSPDGHCRPFDANAQGTVEGNGVGVVILKRLDEAIQDRDNIYAVIKGSAVNNDGNRKVGFTAPSVDGQSEVIERALVMADVTPQSISYIEAHGTGTILGDPIEIAGLKKVFNNVEPESCGIGSLKSNIGHLDIAAGVSSFIKATLALKNKTIPASLNFEKPNPGLEIENSPFKVVSETTPWERKVVSNQPELYAPLRAGVSSYGIGGTNVHVILEESPELEESSKSRDWKFLALSANSDKSLEELQNRFLNFLEENDCVSAADLAWSQQTRQRELSKRFVLPFKKIDDLKESLNSRIRDKDLSKGKLMSAIKKPSIYFMFPGFGSQYPGMAKELYYSEPIFQMYLDECLKIAENIGENELRDALLNPQTVFKDRLNEADLSQLALFIFEYSLAKLLIYWDITPSGLIGHSLGEYTSACLSGVFNLEAGIKLVLTRGKLMKSMPKGKMISVNASAQDVIPYLSDNNDVTIAAINTPDKCTISGSIDEINKLVKVLMKEKIMCIKLPTNHAFHSRLMEGAHPDLSYAFKKTEMNKPEIPYISNLTGDWINNNDSNDPNYYSKHLSNCVKFAQGIDKILEDKSAVLIEVGPGRALSSFSKQANNYSANTTVNTIREESEEIECNKHLIGTLSNLWGTGVNINWQKYYNEETRNRIELPQYPFQRKKFQIGKGDFTQYLEGKANIELPTFPQDEEQKTEQRVQTSSSPQIGEINWVRTFKLSKANDEDKRTCLILGSNEHFYNLLNNIKDWRFAYYKKSEKFIYNGLLNGQIRDNCFIDYFRLLKNLISNSQFPNTIIFTPESWNELKKDLKLILMIAKDFKVTEKIEFIILTSSSEQKNCTTITSYINGVHAEHSNLKMKHLQANTSEEEWQNIITLELNFWDNQKFVKYENGQRYIKKFQPIYNTETIELGKQKANMNKAMILCDERNLLSSISLANSINMDGKGGIKVLPYRVTPLLYSRDVISNITEIFNQNESSSTINTKGKKLHALFEELITSLTFNFISEKMQLRQDSNFTLTSLRNNLNIDQSLNSYLDYLLSILIEDRVIRKTGDEGGYTLLEPGKVREVNAIKKDILEIDNENAQLDIISELYNKLGLFLSGKFSGQSIYRSINNKYNCDTVIKEEDLYIFKIIKKVLSKITDSTQTVQILDISKDSTLLKTLHPILNDLNVEYSFVNPTQTTIDELQHYAEKVNMDYLNIKKSSFKEFVKDEDREPESFDIVIAAHSISTNTYVADSCQTLQKFLKPNGLVFVIEHTKQNRTLNILNGLMVEWWDFKDRVISPTISENQLFNAVKDSENLYQTIAFTPKNSNCCISTIIVSQKKDTSYYFDKLDKLNKVTVLPSLKTESIDGLKKSLNQQLINDEIEDIYLIDEILNRGKNDNFIQPKNCFELELKKNLIKYLCELQKINVCILSVIPNKNNWCWRDTEWLFNKSEHELEKSYSIYMSGSDIKYAYDTFNHMRNSGIPQLHFLNHLLIDDKRNTHDDKSEVLNEMLEIEKLVKRIWSKLLGRVEIDLNSDFFELGGDSFKLIQMTVDLESAGYQVLMNDVYKYPTIRSLTSYLYQQEMLSIKNINNEIDLENELTFKTGILCKVKNDLAYFDSKINVIFLESENTGDISIVRETLVELKVKNDLLPNFILLSNHKDINSFNVDLKEITKPQLNTLLRELESEQRLYTESIVKQPTSQTFGLSNIQKGHFKGNSQLQLYLIELKEMVNINMMERAFCDVVSSHGLLRSSLLKKMNGYKWKEHSAPLTTTLPFVDLTGYTSKSQKKVMRDIVTKETSSDFMKQIQPMYHVILIKFNEKEYNLFFQYDHSIIDLTSAQIIRQQILQRYREIMDGTKEAIKLSTNYQDYLKVLNKGPINITPESLINKFDLQGFSKNLILAEKKIKEVKTARIHQLRYSIDLSRFQNEYDPFDLTAQIYLLVISRILKIDHVPFNLIVHNRRYQDHNFSDLVGLVLDGIPLNIPVNRENPNEMTTLISERMTEITKHNVNFMNLVWNFSSLIKWRKVMSELKGKNFHCPFLLNFAGNAESEYDKVWDMSLQQLDDEDQKGLDYADFYGIVKLVNNQLDFLVLSKIQSDMDNLKSIFEEETSRLVNYYNGKLKSLNA